MSWSVSTIIKASSIDAGLAALVIPYSHDAESDDQLAAAKEHAKAVIASLPKSGYYSVGLSGHAQPGHEVESYSGENINIGVANSYADAYVAQLEAQKIALENEIMVLNQPPPDEDDGDLPLLDEEASPS